ncbi:MAG: RecQ family ATP-dependent DNA helicase [Chitinispirillales bacterium]|nr:RecQ family ATP-dependent DNA helicase [Chitinispirillales bacterium]
MAMTAHEALKHYFGHNDFRGGQETLINGILAGKDTVGIMPTGAGKSICFQVPSLMMDGVALVVSPLIALMKDQVNALTRSGIPAAYVNSSLTQGQVDKALRNAVNGAYKLIYVAPERLPTPDFMAFARSVNISMLAVDEAHCISQWGHDFRPSYTRIPDFIAKLSKRPVLSAFTATATPKVRADILAQLNLRDPQILIAGFDRKNLYFGARKPRNKYDALTAFLKEREGRSGIVYCGTRSYVEIMCKRLKVSGYSVSRYHAGLLDKERHDNQDDFLYDRIKIMVATNAFGMGIDKSNVSFVLHLNMPKDIESYYQEAGRAGRNGEPAECVLFYSDRDIRMNAWLLENDKESWHSDKEIGRRLKDRSRERMRDIVSYCTTTGCLRGFILKYFGETPPDKCGNCDRCNAVAVTTDEADTVKKVGAKKKTAKAKTTDKAVTKKEAVKAKIAVKADTKKDPTKTNITDSVDTQKNVVNTKIAGKAVAKKKTIKAKITDKAATKKKTGVTAYNEDNTADVVTHVKITDKPAPVSAIAGRINEYLAPRNRREVSAAGINEWLVSEGYIDTINDKGKNRKISTDNGISAGIITEIRKVGGERVRVNQFDRKAQEMVIAKFCGAEGFADDYAGLTEPAQNLCKQFLENSTVTPDLTPRPNEEREIELEEPALDEHGADAETLPFSDDSTVMPGLSPRSHEEQGGEREEQALNEYDTGAETFSEPVETIKQRRTMFSIIIDALKSLGMVFSKK